MVSFALLAALYMAQTNVPAPADVNPQQTPRDIVVEGTRQKQQRVRTFVKALSADVPSFGQIGKFHSPVCPSVIGLPPAQNKLVADRMKRVAAAAGMRVGDLKCRPNVFLIATGDKGGTIEALNESFPAYFSGMASEEVRKLAGSAEPAVAWQIKGLLSADGTQLKKVAGAGHYINEGTNSGSRVRAGTMPAFVASMVVADLGSLAGLSVTQVADYAAMRAFADTDPRRASGAGAPTILSILEAADDQPVPVTLTQWDLGYLKSLYATSNAYYASYQRGDMEHVMEKELATGSEQGR